MTSKDEKITEEQVKDNLETGIVMAIEEKKRGFFSTVDELASSIAVKPNSKSMYALNELVRIIKSAATFPSAQIPKSPSERELKAVQDLYSIKDLQIELAICTIGRAQEDNDNAKEQENE